MKPLMTPREIRIIKKALLSSSKNGREVKVLEWGSGGSTVYFTKFLQSQNVPYQWHSLEYNKGWYERVLQELEGDSQTKLVIFDVGNNVLRQRYVEMEDYIKYPSTLGKKFDVIIVDGRKRRRCLLEAKNLLNEGGTVFLHDAQRKYYQCAFAEYSNNSFTGVYLWRGNNEKIGYWKKISNQLKTFFYKVLYKLIVRPTQFILGHMKLKFRLTKELLLQAKDWTTKLKMLAMVFLLALKKRNIPVFNTEMNLKIKSLKRVVTVSVSSYADAVGFHKDVINLKNEADKSDI